MLHTSRREKAKTGEPSTPEQAIEIMDEVLEFLRGGLDILRRA